MGTNATLNPYGITINVEAWIEQRAGGEIDDLAELFSQFDEAITTEHPYGGMDTVPWFIIARAGRDWEYAEGSRIHTATGGDTLELSDDLLIHRYTDPVFGDVAFIAGDRGPRGIGAPTIYADRTTDYGQWFAVGVDIFCPEGHGWRLCGGELTDDEGTCAKPADVFGPDGIVTLDTDIDAETYGDPRIVCSTCAALCDVEMTSL